MRVCPASPHPPIEQAYVEKIEDPPPPPVAASHSVGNQPLDRTTSQSLGGFDTAAMLAMEDLDSSSPAPRAPPPPRVGALGGGIDDGTVLGAPIHRASDPRLAFKV